MAFLHGRSFAWHRVALGVVFGSAVSFWPLALGFLLLAIGFSSGSWFLTLGSLAVGLRVLAFGCSFSLGSRLFGCWPLSLGFWLLAVAFGLAFGLLALGF